MANYDYVGIKKFIQMHSDLIERVELGMQEDWFWTATPIYEDGKFLLDLDEEPEIAGLKGSSWATPVMDVHYKDGSEETKPAYVRNVTPEKKPVEFALGVLSSPCQDVRDGKYIN